MLFEIGESPIGLGGGNTSVASSKASTVRTFPTPSEKNLQNLNQLHQVNPELERHLEKINLNEIEGDFRPVDLSKWGNDAEMNLLLNTKPFMLEQLYFDGKPTNRGKCSYCTPRMLDTYKTSIWAIGDKHTKLKRQNVRSHLLRHHVDQPKNRRGRILNERMTKNDDKYYTSTQKQIKEALISQLNLH